MKKLCVLAVLCLFGMTAKAQSYSFPELKSGSSVSCSLGLSAGADISSFAAGAGSSYKPAFTPGLNAGLVFNMRFLRRNERSNAETGVLAIQPEVRYAMMGCSELKTSNILVPVMFQVYPSKNFYIELGPEFCLNLSNNPEEVNLNNDLVLNTSKLKANDVLLGVGLGYYLIKGLNIGIRYNYGLSQIAGNLPWKNSVIQVNLGYNFTFQKKHNTVIEL